MKIPSIVLLSFFVAGTVIARKSPTILQTTNKTNIDKVVVTSQKTGVKQIFSQVPQVMFLAKHDAIITEQAVEVRLYPNPSNGKANINFFNPVSGQVTVSAINLAGQLIAQTESNLQAGNVKALINNLPQGIIVIRVAAGDRIYTAKAVVESANIGKTTISFTSQDNNNSVNTTESANVEYTIGEFFDVVVTVGAQEVKTVIEPDNMAMVEIDPTSCVDNDGNNYKTVQIGTQLWMAENLRTTRYANGVKIDNITDNAEWKRAKTPAYSIYNNRDNNELGGYLYNGYAATDSRNICPSGWRVPTDADWNALQQSVSGPDDAKRASIYLLAENQWNRDAADMYGFSATPAGLRYAHDGSFGHLGTHARWWTQTSEQDGKQLNRYINFNNEYLGRGSYSKNYGYSVRCVKE